MAPEMCWYLENGLLVMRIEESRTNWQKSHQIFDTNWCIIFHGGRQWKGLLISLQLAQHACLKKLTIRQHAESRGQRSIWINCSNKEIWLNWQWPINFGLEFRRMWLITYFYNSYVANFFNSISLWLSVRRRKQSYEARLTPWSVLSATP